MIRLGQQVLKRFAVSFYKEPLELKSTEGESFKVSFFIFRGMILLFLKPPHPKYYHLPPKKI